MPTNVSEGPAAYVSRVDVRKIFSFFPQHIVIVFMWNVHDFLTVSLFLKYDI
jgi:hypothetical protein